MFERDKTTPVKDEPLRPTDLWALEWLRGVPFEQRTVAACAARFGCPVKDTEETFKRLTKWKLII